MMDMADDFSNSTSTRCAPLVSQMYHYILDGVAISVSITIFIVLAFIKRRVRLAPNCCHGHPGLPVPMDFLIAPRHRWIYVAIFGVMAVSAFSAFNNLNDFNSTPNSYLNLFIKLCCLPLLTILIISLQFFPLFACVDSTIPLVGHVMGLIYAILWYVVVLAKVSSLYMQSSVMCDNGNTSTNGVTLCLNILRDAPNLIVCAVIVIWYLYQLVVGVIRCYTWMKQRRQGFLAYHSAVAAHGYILSNSHRFPSLCNDNQIQRVKALLKRPADEVFTQSSFHKQFMRVYRYIFPYDKYFRLPLPFLGVVATMVMLLYQLCFELGFLGIAVLEYFRSLYGNINSTGVFADIIPTLFLGMPVLLVLSPILSMIVCLLMLLHMIGSISKMMKTVAKRGFSEQLPGVLSRLPASWKYVGLQAGFFICAWLLYYLVFIVLGGLLILLYVLIRIPSTRNWTINTILGVLIPIVWARAIFYSQYLICKVLFFADKEGKFISITNRNLFNWFSFVLFFYNGLAGFVGGVFRIALSSVFSLILLFRLDEVALMKKFASFDFGHRAFLGFFYLDYAYNNAVVHVFIMLLKSVLDENSRTPSETGSTVETEPENISTSRFPPARVNTRQRIRNRWLVAYTLIRNPSLQNLPISNLASSVASEDSKCENEESFEAASIQVHGKQW